MISSIAYSLESMPTAMDGGIGLFLLGIEGAEDDTAIYAYDNRNNLIKAVVGENTTLSKFNGDGLRVERAVNGRTLRYLLKYDRIILEVNAEGAETARNIFGINLIQRSADADTFLYLFNGRGDVTALVNPNGTVAVQYYYDPWGNIIEETARVNNPFRYAGYRWDEESGLYYLNARHYNPTIARFMQEDTFRGSILDPLSLNFYTYCNNEPIMYFDPTGHSRVFVDVRSDGSRWIPEARGYVHPVTGSVVSRTPEWTTSGGSSSSSGGSSGSGSTGGSSGGGGLGGVNFGPNQGADWLRTGSGLSFEAFWGVTPFGMAFSNQATSSSMVRPPSGGTNAPTVQGISSQQAQSNINSAFNAFQGGFLSFAQFSDNVVLNLSMAGISGEALHFATSLVTGAKNSNEVMAFATFFTSFMGSGNNFRGQEEGVTGYGGIFAPLAYVNHKYGLGWLPDPSRSIQLTLSNFLQSEFGNEQNCTIVAITRIFAFYRDVHEMSGIPRHNASLYRHIRNIALQHGYRPGLGTPPTRIDNIMNDVLRRYNLEGQARNNYLPLSSTAKAEIDAGRPFLFNIATGFYANHTVTVIGYQTFTRGNETKTLFSVYDGWEPKPWFVDLDVFNGPILTSGLNIGSFTTMTIK